ncbi:MAG: ATP-binding protein [Candidatus Cloacimonetes bacterium]|nr:ATP-binding protein [Candidatus Cloacimonadota bacterium]
MYHPRQLEATARSLFNSFPVLTLTGPRQSGKTTLVRHLFPELAYLNLEEPQIRALMAADPIAFLDAHPQGMLLDEIQRLPELLSHIQARVDARPGNGQFVITGSEQTSLRSGVSQSLAGRTAMLRLLPLSMAELDIANSGMSVEELLFSGFYPRIQLEHQPPYHAHSAYIQTYLERDLRQQGEIRLMSTFQSFLALCAGRVGQLLNLHSMANELGTATSTLRNWISLLEDACIVFLLQPWHANLGKRLVKTPKLYFHDVGLASFLLGIEHASQLNNHPLKGNLFENLCVSEALKHRYNRGLRSNLFFYRDSTGNEVDLVLENVAGPLLLEIKSSRTLHQDSVKGMAAFMRATGQSNPQRVIVYQGESRPSAFGARAIHHSELDRILAESNPGNPAGTPDSPRVSLDS